MYEVAIVGAGISGLTAGLVLSQRGAKVLILEKENRVGGSILTLREQGYIVELGPNTVLLSPSFQDKLKALLGDLPFLEANKEAKKRYVLKDNRLIPLPASPLSFLTSPLFTWKDKLRILGEPFRKPVSYEESIASFARRRLGESLYRYAVGPFVRGVFAGDGEKLSVRWATPKIYQMEKDYGSLIKASIALRKGPEPPGALVSFPQGLASLPERMAQTIQARGNPILLNQEVQRITLQKGEWHLGTKKETFHARKLLITGDSKQVASMLSRIEDGLGISRLPYAGVVVLAMGWDKTKIHHPLEGFGFLTPPDYPSPLLGCLFTSSIFPKRAPKGKVLLTAFLGGARYPEVTTWKEEHILEETLKTLTPLLNLEGKPETLWLRRWHRAIPQYEINHGAFVQEVLALEKTYPHLTIGGNLLYGVSLAKCMEWHHRWASQLGLESSQASQ